MWRKTKIKATNILTKAGHPDVGSDVDPDPVVPFFSSEHVIPDKHHLHPALPFFCLVPVVGEGSN